jgi:predicted double-glycine peptidase
MPPVIADEMIRYYALSVLVFSVPTDVLAQEATFPFFPGEVIKPFNIQKYNKITPQVFDSSCGAASVANIISEYYRIPTNELVILANMNIHGDRSEYSFEDLRYGVEFHNLTPVYVATNYEALLELKIPVIAHLRLLDGNHFSVIRAVTENYIFLADPAWGNVKLTRAQFEEKWLSDTNEGRIMAIISENNINTSDEYFGLQNIDKSIYMIFHDFR